MRHVIRCFYAFLFFSHWSFLVTRRWEGWGRTLVHPSLFWLLVPHLPEQWGLSKATLLDLSAALFRFLCYCSRICTDQRWYRNATLSRITLQFVRQITRDLFSLALHITQICQNPIVEILCGRLFGFVLVAVLDLCWWQAPRAIYIGRRSVSDQSFILMRFPYDCTQTQIAPHSTDTVHCLVFWSDFDLSAISILLQPRALYWCVLRLILMRFRSRLSPLTRVASPRLCSLKIRLLFLESRLLGSFCVLCCWKFCFVLYKGPWGNMEMF